MAKSRKLLSVGLIVATVAMSFATTETASAWVRAAGYGRRGVVVAGRGPAWGYRGGYGAGAVAGAAVAGAAIGAAAASRGGCYQHIAQYDEWGSFVGYQSVPGPC